MTPVEFTFRTPEGVPIDNVPFTIQLTKAGYDEDETGIIVPSEVIATTDATGKVIVNLWPSQQLYTVTFEDPVSQATVYYKFYVPSLEVEGTIVRLQDIVVDAPMSGITYDEAALLQIHEAKSNAMAAQVTAQAAAVTATEANTAAQTAKTVVLASETTAVGAAVTAVDAKTAAQLAESNAKTSETRAITKAGEANASAVAAEQFRDEAEDIRTVVYGYVGTVAASETAAKGSEEAAFLYMNNASGFKTAAETASVNAAVSETAANAAKLVAQAAETSIVASRDLAIQKAQAAENSALAAKASQDAAKGSEDNAKGYATAAELSKNTAVESASTAVIASTTALGAAMNLSTAVTSAQTSAQSASQSASTATTKAQVAVDKAAEAHQWAETAAAAAEGAVAGQLPADWLATTGATRILNKPTIPTTKADFGLNNVENKSSETIRGELTKANIQTPLAGVLRLENADLPQVIFKDTNAGVNEGQWGTWVQQGGGGFSIGPQDDVNAGTAALTLARNGDALFNGGNLNLDYSGKSQPMTVTLKGDANTHRMFQITSGNTPRWKFGVHAATESGTNIGSDFVFHRYSDTGGFIDAPVVIYRNSGDVQLARKLVLKGATTSLIFDSAISNRLTWYQTNGSNRWAVGVDGVAEGGSNAGSRYFINRYDDAGVYMSTPFSIDRASGITQVEALSAGAMFHTGATQVDRNTDTIFYSGNSTIIQKNTVNGMKASLALNNVNNTSDANKPVSTATQNALNAKLNAALANQPMGYAGLDVNARLILKNTANTINSVVENSNTAARKYILPDASGTIALKSDLDAISQAPIIGSMVLPYGNHVVTGNYVLTLPSLVEPKQLSLTTPYNVVEVPAEVITANGWKVSTQFSTTICRTISPIKYGPVQGWWGSAPMEPPLLGSLGTGTNTTKIITEILVGDVEVKAITVSTNVMRLIAINRTTGAAESLAGDISIYSTATGLSRVKLITLSSTKFALVYPNAASTTAIRIGELSGVTITLGPVVTYTTGGTTAADKLGTDYIVLIGTIGSNTTTTNGILVAKVEGNTTVLYGKSDVATSNAVTCNLKILSATEFAIVGPIGVFTSIRSRKYTLTGTSVAANNNLTIHGTWSANANNILVPINATQSVYWSQLEGTPNKGVFFFTDYITDNLTSLTVDNAGYPATTQVPNSGDHLNWGFDSNGVCCAVTLTGNRILMMNENYMWVVKLTGTSLSVGPLVPVPAAGLGHLFAGAHLGSRIFWRGMGSTTANRIYAEVFVNDVTVTFGASIAGTPKTFFSPTLNDATITIDGEVCKWTGVPTALSAVGSNKYLSLGASPYNITLYGNFNE